MFSLARVAFIAATALLTASAAGAAAVPRGLLDHSLCCGVPPSAVDGGSFFDPASDPVFSRRRLPPPGAATEQPPPATVAAAAPLAPAGKAGTVALPPPTKPAAMGGEIVVPPGSDSSKPLQLPTELVAGHLRVGFNVLGGYPFQLSKTEAAAAAPEAAQADDVLAQIPEIIRQLDGQKVLVSGFMLPMKMEGTLTTEFLLVANSMLCCYGVVPPMNQWMVVQMSKGGVNPQQDVPLAFFGTLRVKPRFDDGALSAIYHLEGDRLHVP